MTVMTRTMMLIGLMAGKMTHQHVDHGFAPSISAASRRDGSTDFSPARYSTITYPICRHDASTRIAHRVSLGLPSQSIRSAFELCQMPVLIRPKLGEYMNSQMIPISASDSMTGRNRTVW